MAETKRQSLPWDATAALMDTKKPDKGKTSAEVVQMTPGQARKLAYDRERKRAIYDLPDDLISAVADLAARWDCSRSDAAAWLLTQGVGTVAQGAEPETEPGPRGNTRNRWALILPEIPLLR